MKLLLPFLLFFSSTATFNPETIQTFQGRVSSVQKFADVTRPTPHMQLLLRTKSGEVAVDVGPVWYLEAEGIDIAPDDEIEVVGSVVEIEGTSYVIATSLTLNGVTYQLRTSDGGALTMSYEKGRKLLFC